MNKVVCLLVLIVLIGYFFETRKSVKENFSSGTEIQLLTSKPYFTMYDYYTQMAKYPYYSSYPGIYGNLGYPGMYGYGSQYGYPYYEPTYLPTYF